MLYNYTANQAEIGCKVDGEEYLLQFIRLQNLKHIWVSTNKSVRRAIRITTIDAQEVEVNRLGQLDMSRKGELYPDLPERLLDNTLLFISKLANMAYKYLDVNWASIINLGICKSVAEDISGLVYDNYRDITIEPFLGGKLAIYGFLEDGRRIRLGDLGEGVQSYVIARIRYELEKPKVLLWDDIEAHLNPKMLLSIAEWFFDMLDLKEMEEYLDAGIGVRVAEPLLL